MSFITLLDEVRPAIEASLLKTLIQAKKDNVGRFLLDDWLFEVAMERVSRGKLMRGGLLIGAYKAFGGSDQQLAVQAAAAIELYGTGLLMQDDVTDRSKTRRGLPTVHLAAQQLATEQSLSDPEHFGTNCGIYLADILFFLAHELFDQLTIDPKKVLTINTVCDRELWLLGLAQLEELRVSQSPVTDDSVTQEQILTIFAGKTGRYSIAWPLQVGALLADVSPELIKVVATIGEQIGVLFQLRDDELGLFGDPSVSGKSNDDDIREGKKTLYWLELCKQLPAADPRWQIFGNPTATAVDVDQLREVLRASGGEASVRELMQKQHTQLEKAIFAKKLPAAVQTVLKELLTFVIERKK